MKTREKRNLIFYICIATVPILQFVVMWGIVNINTLRLAFMTWDTELGEYVWAGFDNFKSVISDFLGTNTTGNSIITPYALGNSVKAYLISLVVNTPLCFMFAFYVYKKLRMSKVFQVVLYLPCIVSAIVMTTIYLYFVEEFIPESVPSLGGEGLLSNPETAFVTLIIFSLFYGFGNTAMIYISTMESINPSVIEAAKMDGCNSFQEFVYICFPLCFNIIKLNLTTGLMAILGNDLHLYAFFGGGADERIHTIGYCLTVATLHKGKSYPYLAAYSLLVMIFITPIIMRVKKMFDRMDPLVDQEYAMKRKKKRRNRLC